MSIKISRIHARLQKAVLGKIFHVDQHAEDETGKVAASLGIHDGDPKHEPKKRVMFMGRDTVRRHKFNPEDVLISISDSGIEPPLLSHQPLEVLALAFHDHVTANEIKDLGWRQMNREDGIKIVEFVLKHTDAPNIIVHCNVGESRSKGAALAISEITDRSTLHVSDNGRITNYKRREHDYFNRRVYEMILMEHMRLDD